MERRAQPLKPQGPTARGGGAVAAAAAAGAAAAAAAGAHLGQPRPTDPESSPALHHEGKEPSLPPIPRWWVLEDMGRAPARAGGVAVGGAVATGRNEPHRPAVERNVGCESEFIEFIL